MGSGPCEPQVLRLERLLEPLDGGRRSRFTWTEELTFPWWMGGPLGAAAARPVLGRIWSRNLVNLQSVVADSRRDDPATTAG